MSKKIWYKRYKDNSTNLLLSKMSCSK